MDEHLESSGTKVFMNGPIVRKICVWKEKYVGVLIA